MKVFLTAISECDKKGFIEDTVKIVEKNGHDIKYFSMGDMLMNELKSQRNVRFNSNNVLNMDEGERAKTIESIINKIKLEMPKHENVIISGHATFYWNNNFTNAFDANYLRELNPDMYITLIDNTEMIYQNILASKQFSSQKMTRDDVLTWQNVEVNTTTLLSQAFDKEHYILPRRESSGLLYKIMMRPEIELVYASFPMSHLKTEEDKMIIDNFVKRLNEYFAVITPRSIELSKEFTPKEGAQTVLRDENWFTGKASKIIVYYMPTKDLVYSAGVAAEISKAFRTTKDILAIFPQKNYGPFEKYYMKDMFYSEDEFFKHLDNNGYKKHNLIM